MGDDAYLHTGKPDEEEVVITVAGIPDAQMAGMYVLLVGHSITLKYSTTQNVGIVMSQIPERFNLFS